MNVELEIKEQIAKDLLSIKAVFLSVGKPFIWASGIKSPIYCDNRLTLTSPLVRTHVEEGIITLIKNHYPEVEVVMGTATAGIAHAAIVGHLMNLPMGYVRADAKSHGRENKIEGNLKPGQKVVVVEDLISTAGSSLEVVKTLKEAGAIVLGIVSIFTYGLKKGVERLENDNVKNVSLTNLDTILDVAVIEKYISEIEKEKILKFRSNPSDESWIKG